jgi:hypothetical protein
MILEMIAVSTGLFFGLVVSLLFAFAALRVLCLVLKPKPSSHHLSTTYLGDANHCT